MLLRSTSLFIALLIGSVSSLEASASCCSGASSAGIGRLRLHERAYVALSNDAHRVLGSFDRFARFHRGQASHLPHWRFNYELQAMLRVLDWLQPFIKLPARTQISAVRVGANPADMSIGAHMPLFDEEFFRWGPALSLTSALKLPTGIAAGSFKDLAEEDITSMGLYELSFSLMLQKSLGAINAALGYGIAFAPSIFMGSEYTPGIAHSITTAISFIPHQSGHLQFTLSPTLFANAYVQGRALPNSSRRQLGFSMAYSLMIHSHLTLNGTLGTNLPIAGIGKNSESDIFGQLGLRVGVF